MPFSKNLGNWFSQISTFWKIIKDDFCDLLAISKKVRLGRKSVINSWEINFHEFFIFKWLRGNNFSQFLAQNSQKLIPQILFSAKTNPFQIIMKQICSIKIETLIFWGCVNFQYVQLLIWSRKSSPSSINFLYFEHSWNIVQ